ncbi:MAG: arsenate reductase family protein [Myxococcota bacterium]
MSVQLFGIPTCDSCRKARKWLDAHGVDHEWVDFRQTPPSTEQVTAWVETLGSKVLRNTSGGAYRALGDEKKDWSDAQWAAAFAEDPMLIKRPVLVVDGTAVRTGFKADEFDARFAS